MTVATPGTAPLANGRDVAAEWRARAVDLAEHAWRTRVERVDVWGGYLPVAVRKVGSNGSVTKPSRDKRGRVFLTPDTIRRHFAGRDHGDVIGLHSANTKNECRRIVIEIDNHDKQPATAERNFNAAVHWFDKLTSMGFSPMLIDSDGGGGFHVEILTDAPVHVAAAYHFIRGACDDFAALGFPKRPECFPKQEFLADDDCGNWLRLAGFHHTRNHWSRIYDRAANRWLEGAQAVDAFLAYWGDPSELVPEPPAPTAHGGDRKSSPHFEDLKTAEKLAKRRPGRETDAEVALRCLDHIEPPEDYDGWLSIIAAANDAGVSLEDVEAWSAKGAKYEQDEIREKWATFTPGKRRGARVATLIELARRAGYEPYPKRNGAAKELPERFSGSKPGDRSRSGGVGAECYNCNTSPQNEDKSNAAEPAATQGSLGKSFPQAIDESVARGSSAVVDQARDRVRAALKIATEDEAAGPLLRSAADLAALPADEVEDLINVARDALGRKLRVSNLRAAIRAAGAKQAMTVLPDDKPKVNLGWEWDEVVRATARILSRTNEPPRRFERMAVPTRLVEDEKGRKIIAPMSDTYLRGEMGREITFYTFSEKRGETNAPPPLDVARDLGERFNETLLAIGERPLPPLMGLVETPVLRPDGSILIEPGYDAATGLFYWPATNLSVPPIPAKPSAHDLAAALALVTETIGDFPYESDVDRANAFGLFITPAVRHLVPLVPIGIIDAPQAGTGKSLLASTVHAVATGQAGNMLSVPADNEEMRKLITSSLMEGASVMLLDNLDGALFHPALARAITATIWKDRKLGVMENVALPQLATWIVTGNNVSLGGDMPRRCYRVRLDAKSSKPWDDGRTFAHEDLIPWVLENRGRIIGAVLTLCRAWFVAGRPKYETARLGSFEDWSHVTGSILAHAGINGFLANRDELYAQADEDGPQWQAFLTAWFAKYRDRNVTVATIERDIPDDGELRDALPDTLSGFVERMKSLMTVEYRVTEAGRFKIRLGKALKQRIGRRYGPEGFYVSTGTDTHKKTAVWSVKSATAGSAGSGGSDLEPSAGENQIRAHVTCAPHTHSRVDIAKPLPATHRTPRNLDEDDFEEIEREAIREADQA